MSYIPLSEAMATVARRLRVDSLAAWDAIRTEVRCEMLTMRHRGAQVQSRVLPALMDYLAEFGEEKIAYPSGDTVWIDRTAAKRAGLEDKDIPLRLAGLVVNKCELAALWPGAENAENRSKATE